jgi:heme oxygenase
VAESVVEADGDIDGRSFVTRDGSADGFGRPQESFMTLLERLKEETRACHRSIERVVPLMRPDLSITAYRAYLHRLLGYYRPVEARLGAWAGWSALGIDFEARRKVPLLERDLARLPERESAEPEPSGAPVLPELTSPARKLGCLYVLEGSTLGGQVLVRHVRRELGLQEANGCAFLAGYGTSTGRMWRSFTAALDAYARREGHDARVVDAARETFVTLEAWLSGGASSGREGTDVDP